MTNKIKNQVSSFLIWRQVERGNARYPIPNSNTSYCCKKISFVYLIVQKLWSEHSRTNTNDNITDVEITEKTPRQFKQRQKSVQTLLGSLDQQYRPCKMAPLSLRYYFTRPKSKTNWSASKWPRTTFRVVSRKFPRMSAAAAASEHWWRQTQVWFENNNPHVSYQR